MLLTRLSIFAGGFTLVAAEAVTADDAFDTDEVFDLLATLVARSMVAADTEGLDTRYRLLETIRQYAQDHLDKGGDGDRLRAEHARYYAGFAETAIGNVVNVDGAEWEQRLVREYDNLRTALTWATETHDIDVALRLLGLWDAPNILTDASMLSTARWACDSALTIPGATEHPRYPSALAIAAFFAWSQGDHALAERRCLESLDAEQRLGTTPGVVVHMVQVNVALAQGRADQAVEHGREAVAMGRLRGEPARLANALAYSALAHTLAGDPAAAIPQAEEVVLLDSRPRQPPRGAELASPGGVRTE